MVGKLSTREIQSLLILTHEKEHQRVSMEGSRFEC